MCESLSAQYEAARRTAARLYPPILLMRSAYNSGADHDASACVTDDETCTLRFYNDRNELRLTKKGALELAEWLRHTFADREGG